MRMPSQEEQLIAEQYVLERELERPDTDVKNAIRCFCLFIGVSFSIAFVGYLVCDWLDIFSLLPKSLVQLKKSNPIWFRIIYVLLVYAVCLICCLRTMVIGLIRLYQHYAPEDVRRRCLFKPTCSEYAILAIKKYGLIIGLVKAYIRLFKKCKGNIYKIDYP